MIKLYSTVENVSEIPIPKIDDLHACPDAVTISDLNLNLTYQGGLTFVVGVDKNGNLRLITNNELTHTNLLILWQTRFGKLYNIVEGRLWINEKIISVWNDVASSDIEVIEDLFRDVDNIDISNYIFVSEFDDKRGFAVDVQTYEKLGLSNDWCENDWKKLESVYKKTLATDSNVKSTNKLGFSDRDYMRHYLYSEGKINEYAYVNGLLAAS